MASMYILKCADGSYYVGSTKSLESRVWQHQHGQGALYISQRLPVELVYCEDFSNIADAFTREKQIRNWSRAKREALVRGDFHRLPGLSKKKFLNKK